METMMQKIRIHPLMAGAAVAVIIASAVAVGAMTMVVAVVAFTQLRETFGRDLDFVEPT